MGKKIKLKGKLKFYLQAALYLGVILALINIFIFFISMPAGAVLFVFTAFYLVVVAFLMHNNRSVMMNELVNFATQYGQVQRRLLRDLEIPYALMDEEGRIIWFNSMFEKVTHREKDYKKSITGIFPSLTKDKLPGPYTGDEVELNIDYEGSNFAVRMKRIPLKEMAENSDVIDAKGYDGYIIAIFLFDETALRIALQEVDDQSLAVGLIYMDNYDEALESVEDVRRSLLSALIERKVNKYVSNFDGICRKLEKDKYLVILRKKAVIQMCEERFELLEDVKTVNIGNEMAVTLSMGIGLDGLSYAQNSEFARNAIDLALGRGGDQAVVKRPDNISYFGGKSQQVEKSTRVKARVKAQALQEIISGKDEVYVMGHRMADVDSFGAAIGIYRIAKTMDKPAHIVMSDPNSSVLPMVELFKNNDEYESDMIINNTQAIDMVGNNAVLVIVDVSKPSITQCPELIKYCKSIVVLDHHRQGTEVVENATLSYIEAYASSTCEMASEILQYTSDNVKIKPEEADCLYAGIMIDTNNFMQKTGVRTFEAAAFLRRNGADVTRVRKLFRDGADEYRAKADIVSQAEIFKKYYAISVCQNHDIQNPTLIGAQAANELLNIRGIKASFVLTEYNDLIYVSARSIDEVNVQIIMEKLGGGGHMNVAACQLEGVPVDEAVLKLKDTIQDMIEQGELQP